MGLKDSVTVTAETTLRTVDSLVCSLTMLFEGNIRAEAVITLAAFVAQHTRVAAEDVAADVSWVVAFVVTQRAEVGGLLVVNALVMQA